MSDSNQSEKLRVLYLSYTPPQPSWGGAMAFYRHFVERQDFEIKVVTNCAQFPAGPVPYEPVQFGPSRLTCRLFHTRLMPWFYGPHSLTAWGRVPSAVWQAARQFKPDLVFTIAGSWDYSALVAQRVARRLKIPLVASFNDWFSYGWFPSHPVYHSMIEQRFRRFYHEADLSLCTCEGMREALGPHPNAHILYPIGARFPKTLPPFAPFTANGRAFVVVFAGSMADWYGPMLERLVMAAQAQSAPVEFRFYGSNPSWSREFDARARAQNIFRGHLPFEQLRQEMTGADALILPMGFEDQCAQVERTSFKTKFLDYLSYQKPIVVWGPEYCSAVRVAREFDSAEVCTRPDAAAILEKILAVCNAPERQAALVANARKMYEDRFHPDKIHAELVRKIRQTVGNKKENRKQKAHI
jgi:glycosyltransferase involved in cell wall biosynthesis